MNILIPIIRFSNSGGYRVLSQLANQWIKMGHRVVFLCPATSNDPYYPTIADIVYLDPAGKIAKNNKLEHKYRFSIFSVLNILYKGIRQFKNDFDVILANQSMTAYPVVLAKTKADKFYYIQAYEPLLYYEKKHLIFKFLSWLTYKFPLKRIVNSKIYLNHSVIKAEDFVHAGLDLNLYIPKNPKTHISQEKQITLGCIGRPNPNKGNSDVFEAFKLLRSTHGNSIKLSVAFGYEGIPKIDGMSVLEPHGDINLVDYYKSIDVLIAPNWTSHGALHYPVIEAMACGTPVITTGYVPADETNSWIVPARSPESIVAAVREIMANEDNIVEQKTHKAINDVKPFSWDVVSQKMIDVFLKHK